MKISPAQIRSPFVDEQGMITPYWAGYLREISESALREVIDAGATPSAPRMRKGEMIVLKATGISKTYLVYYDGTNRYYWESAGTDLY